MINFLKKDITTVTSGVVAHGCNCYGVMGAGVALAIKNKWPTVFKTYARVCGKFKGIENDLLGNAQIVFINSNLCVANCFTQVAYGHNGTFADATAVENALGTVCQFATEHKKSLYMPPIGCGLGGLDWEHDVYPIVKSLNNQYHNSLEINICDI